VAGFLGAIALKIPFVAEFGQDNFAKNERYEFHSRPPQQTPLADDRQGVLLAR